MSHTQKTQIDEALLHLFIKDFQPFTVVENEGFLEYTEALNPSYIVPGRKTISKSWIPAKFVECLNDTKLKINDASSLCLTVDTWTSVYTDNFMAVTAHFIDKFELQSVLLKCAQFPGRHTAENIGESLREIANHCNIKVKIVLVVTDNADNIVNAVKDVGWKHMGYFAHSLNLIVKKALDDNPEVSSLIESVKRIVAYFKRSSQATEKLIEYLVKNNDSYRNSTFFMLKRFVWLHEPIKATLTLNNKDLPILTSIQWNMLCELVMTLKPFYSVTKCESGEKYGTSSLVIPLANSLLNVSLD